MYIEDGSETSSQGSFLLPDSLRKRWWPAQHSKQENFILASPDIMPALSLCR